MAHRIYTGSTVDRDRTLIAQVYSSDEALARKILQTIKRHARKHYSPSTTSTLVLYNGHRHISTSIVAEQDDK